MASKRALLGALLLVATAGAAQAQCTPDQVDIRADGSVLRFSVELADTDAERSEGLMFREELGRFAGMLFVYDAPQTATFWMQNTPLPLDMLFFDETGRLVNVHPEAVPFSRDTIFGGGQIQYVLEINGGLAAELGIEPGAELRHPTIDQELAAWPCEAG